MRSPFLPPPDRAGLGRLQLQELVRDYPELLPLLQEVGAGLPEGATRTLPEAVLDALGDELESSLAWRGRGGD